MAIGITAFSESITDACRNDGVVVTDMEGARFTVTGENTAGPADGPGSRAGVFLHQQLRRVYPAP